MKANSAPFLTLQTLQCDAYEACRGQCWWRVLYKRSSYLLLLGFRRAIRGQSYPGLLPGFRRVHTAEQEQLQNSFDSRGICFFVAFHT